MSFHPDKCKALTVKNNARPRYEATYSIAGGGIAKVHEEKDLGVTTDENLNFETHIHDAAGRANRVFG